MGATTGTTNLVDHISEVDSVVNDSANLPISAFDLTPASSLDIKVPDHEKEKETVVMEGKEKNSDVAIEIDDPCEITFETRRSSCNVM